MYNKMQEIKRSIYAMRNGIIAETLRRAGSPYRFIMGVNIPQLKEIAADFGKDTELVALLRADSECRESQLMAPMVCPQGCLNRDEALAWLAEARSREAVDILCHSLLRHEVYAEDLAVEALAAEGSDILAYAGIRLLWNMVNINPGRVKALAEAEADRHRDVTEAEALKLIDEADFLLEGQ